MKTFFLFVIIASLASAAVAQSNPIVFTNVTVIDATGADAQTDMVVVIAGEKISTIGKAGKVNIPKKAQVINAKGKYLIPGFWDMHVHLSWTSPSAFPVFVANGVTGVRDMGGHLAQIDQWKTKIDAGILVGPSIVRAGPILNGKAFNPLQMEVVSSEQTCGIIRALKHVGVDFIKVHRRMPRDAYFAAVEEAKKQGLDLVGHIPMTVTPEEASDTGQATIEHTETLFEGTFTAALNGRKLPEAIRQFRANEAEKLFARFVKNKTTVDPTLVGYRSIIEGLDGSLAKNPLSRYVALSWKKLVQARTTPVSAEELAETRETFIELREVVRQMHLSGVMLLAGTDTAANRIPGFSMHDELALLVECGLTPMQAIQTATINPAKVLKKDEYGTIEANKIANLILLDANPIDDIRNTQKINSVVLRGRLFNRKALDNLLAEGEQSALKN